MQRSGSQKVLLVLSILNIIAAVIMLLGGALMMMGGALFGAVPASEAASALAGTGVTQGQAGALAGIAGFVILFAGVIELILGILGVRAANDNQKIMPVWVLAIISLILNLGGLISTVANGTFSGSTGASYIVSLILAILMMWIANNIKKEAGK